MRLTALLVLTPGCLFDGTTYVDRQKELCHPEAGCVDRPWWPDDDGDGWGDGSAAPVVALEGPEGAVGNALDCAPANANIGADLGLCPDEFGPSVQIDAGSDDTTEWVVVALEEPLLLHEAEDRCGAGGWGGVLRIAEPPAFAFAPVWVDATGTLPPGWAGAPGTEALDGSPVIWDGDALRNAEADDRANVGCERPLADPVDFETLVVP